MPQCHRKCRDAAKPIQRLVPALAGDSLVPAFAGNSFSPSSAEGGMVPASAGGGLVPFSAGGGVVQGDYWTSRRAMAMIRCASDHNP